MQSKLSLYRVDIKYIRDLQNKDDKVRSVSPQINKQFRAFVGIIVVCEDKKYCVPLSSPKPKHKDMKNYLDFSKITDNNNKLIGVLNFNSMIPVDESVLTVLDINIKKSDTPATSHYKTLARKELEWCRKNQDAIVSKANKLYKMVTETPEKNRNLTRRCCDFKKLENELMRYLEKNKNENEKLSKTVTTTVRKGRK